MLTYHSPDKRRRKGSFRGYEKKGWYWGMRFYKIEDQIVISDKGLSVGEESTPNTSDGAFEKHLPVINVEGDTVKVQVSTVEHPSLPAHYIEWIVLETEGGFQMHYLKPEMKPEAVFKTDEKVVAAYEYCNLHGLWKTEV